MVEYKSLDRVWDTGFTRIIFHGLLRCGRKCHVVVCQRCKILNTDSDPSILNCSLVRPTFNLDCCMHFLLRTFHRRLNWVILQMQQ
jgi:hypothetical protein